MLDLKPGQIIEVYKEVRKQNGETGIRKDINKNIDIIRKYEKRMENKHGTMNMEGRPREVTNRKYPKVIKGLIESLNVVKYRWEMEQYNKVGMELLKECITTEIRNPIMNVGRLLVY